MFTGVLTAVIAGYIALVGIIYVGQRGLMYHPGGPIGPPATYGVGEMAELPLENGAGHPLMFFSMAMPGPSVIEPKRSAPT